MSYQQLIESLWTKLGHLTNAREVALSNVMMARKDSERMRQLCESERVGLERLHEVDDQLAELGVALSAVARAAKVDARQV